MGYNTLELKRKFTLVGVDFSDLSGSTSIPVNDFITGDFVEGDQLQIQDGGGGYDILQWRNGAWCQYNTSAVSSKTVERGKGVWVVSQTASADAPVSATVRGAVDLSGDVETTFGRQYVIASPGFPVDVLPNDTRLTWVNFQDGDQLQIPDGGSGYDIAQWKNGRWNRYNSTAEFTVTIKAHSAVWIVSQNADARVVVDPTIVNP